MLYGLIIIVGAIILTLLIIFLVNKYREKNPNTKQKNISKEKENFIKHNTDITPDSLEKLSKTSQDKNDALNSKNKDYTNQKK